MGDEKTTQVNVKLPLSQKREWEQYVEESEETTSLSHLIRLSVEREINDERIAGGDGEIGIDGEELDLDVDVTPIEERLTEVEGTLDRLIDAVESIETKEIADEEEIERISDEIFDTMPRIYEERDGHEVSPSDMAAMELIPRIERKIEEQGRSIRELVQNETFHGWVEAYQRYFDVDNYTMKKALERVQQYSTRVHVVDDYEYRVVFEIDEERANH